MKPNSDPAYFDWLISPDGGNFAAVRDLGDGRYAGVARLLFHWTLKIGMIGDDVGYDDRWCYATEDGARVALAFCEGTGDPTGWHRHPATGRRRPSRRRFSRVPHGIEEIHSTPLLAGYCRCPSSCAASKPLTFPSCANSMRCLDEPLQNLLPSPTIHQATAISGICLPRSTSPLSLH